MTTLEWSHPDKQTNEKPLVERYFAKLLLTGNDLDAVANVGRTKCTMARRTHAFVDSATKTARMVQK